MPLVVRVSFVVLYRGSRARRRQKHFIVASSLRKARDIQDVFKSHLMAGALIPDKVQDLAHDELCYLAGWEAEKYRQAL
jgi:hypothetical protein